MQWTISELLDKGERVSPLLAKKFRDEVARLEAAGDKALEDLEAEAKILLGDVEGEDAQIERMDAIYDRCVEIGGGRSAI